MSNPRSLAALTLAIAVGATVLLGGWMVARAASRLQPGRPLTVHAVTREVRTTLAEFFSGETLRECTFGGLAQPNEEYRASIRCDGTGKPVWYSPDYKPAEVCIAAPDPFLAPAGECPAQRL